MPMAEVIGRAIEEVQIGRGFDPKELLDGIKTKRPSFKGRFQEPSDMRRRPRAGKRGWREASIGLRQLPKERFPGVEGLPRLLLRENLDDKTALG